MSGSCAMLLLLSGTAVLMLVSAKSCYNSLRHNDDAQLPAEVINKVHQPVREWNIKDVKIGDKPDIRVCNWGCQIMICVKDGVPIFAVNACAPPKGGCDFYINNACKGTFNCTNCEKDLCNKEMIELPPPATANNSRATTYASSRSTTTSAGVRLLLMMIFGVVSIIHCAMAVLLVV
uniref:Secreted protein n=1 Tax=Globodera pallida TaxID=36090 RepID=A0A183BRG5_GLOPA